MHGGAVFGLAKAQVRDGAEFMELLLVGGAGGVVGLEQVLEASECGKRGARVTSAKLLEGEFRVHNVLLLNGELAAGERGLQVACSLSGLIRILAPVRGGVDGAEALLHGACGWGRVVLLVWAGCSEEDNDCCCKQYRANAPSF